VNIKFHQALVTHFQEQRLARFLFRDVGASHDLIDFEPLLTERFQDILSISQHEIGSQQFV
jgi:hypothetical protein